MLERNQIDVIRYFVDVRAESLFPVLYLSQKNLVMKLIELLKQEGDHQSLEWISKMINPILNQSITLTLKHD